MSGPKQKLDETHDNAAISEIPDPDVPSPEDTRPADEEKIVDQMSKADGVEDGAVQQESSQPVGLNEGERETAANTTDF
jgi:hypothetical protein